MVYSEGMEDVKHPDHIEDVARAFQWTASNIIEYGGDPETLFLCGHSAGAHLITLLSLDHSYLKKIDSQAFNNIKGVIGISGVYNFGRLKKLPFFGNFLYLDTVLSTQTKTDIYNISPLTHVHKTGFPFLFLNAKFDWFLTKDTKEMVDALRQVEVDVEFRENVTSTHMSIVSSFNTKDDPVSPIIEEWISPIISKQL